MKPTKVAAQYANNNNTIKTPEETRELSETELGNRENPQDSEEKNHNHRRTEKNRRKQMQRREERNPDGA